MTMSLPSADEQLKFLTNIQRILDEGSFVATYKFALLLAFADYAILAGQGGPNLETITTLDLSESFINSYWRQAIPYEASQKSGGQYLRMSTGAQPEIFSRIVILRNQFTTITDLRSNTTEWRALKSKVADVIARMPLWRLQVIGRELVCFLYHQNGQGYQGRTIHLLPGVLSNFRQHYDLIRNLVQGAWLRHVRRMNLSTLGERDLDEILFGSERTTWDGLNEILKDNQNGECFYCRRRISGEKGDIDHFIPWSRYSSDLGHNFVLAHATCNRSKSDLLASPRHLANWWRRNMMQAASLTASFDSMRIPHDLNTTNGVARWAYQQAEFCGSALWDGRNTQIPADSTWKLALESQK